MEQRYRTMSRHITRIARATLTPWMLACALSLATAAHAASPPTAGYTVKPVCAPPTPGHAACLGLRLEPPSRTSTRGAGAQGSRSASPASATPEAPGLSPVELHNAYQLPTEATEPQTIAIIDAYDDPNAEADLEVFDQEYSLPACTQGNGCFTKVNQLGLSAPLPAANGEWSVEIATDIETAHSLCENCRIVLVEAASASYSNLEAAENTAAAIIQAASPPGAPAGAISNSWGGPEPGGESPSFNHPGIVITASAGDAGYLNWDEYSTEPGTPYFEGADYPASLPHVIAVGGTSLTVGSTGEWIGEKVWNNGHGAGGGGCSAAFAAPPWQSQAAGWSTVGCGSQRAVADVSADADPLTGVHVYDSVPEGLGGEEEVPGEPAPEWMTIGGTSVASPIIASAFALAGGAQGVSYPAATLYANAGSAGLHDITAGGNGKCKGKYSPSCSFPAQFDCGAGSTICNAAAGYDGPTGVGTPAGLSAFQPAPGQTENPEEGSGGGGGNGGGTPPPGGQEGTASPGGGSSAPSQPSGPSTGTSTRNAPLGAGSPVRISGLSLTFRAIAALNRSRPRISKLAFTFTISAADKVRVTLARRVRVRGHWRWSTLPGTNSIPAHAGVNRRRLRGRGTLPPGRYRLTLTPAHGRASSLAISIA